MDESQGNLEVYMRTAQPLVPFVFQPAGGFGTCFAFGQVGVRCSAVRVPASPWAGGSVL